MFEGAFPGDAPNGNERNSAMKKQRFVLIALLVSLLIAGAGCGKVSDTVSNKVKEKAIETALSKDGNKADVTLDKDGRVSSMAIKGPDGKEQKMDMKMDQNGGTMTIKETDENGKTRDVQVSGSGDTSTMTIQSDDGAMKIATGDAAKVPDDFPKDIPLYNGIKLISVQTMPDQKMFHIQATTADAMDKVAAFCKEQYVKQSWTEASSMNQAGDAPMTMISYKKEDRILNVVLMKDKDGTMIQLNTGLQ
jgi:hypothetical protein